MLAASIIRAMSKSSLIALTMEAARIFETSVNFYETTRRSIPQDSHLHTRRRENLKSHQVLNSLCSLDLGDRTNRILEKTA
jgi:hypothetical protein